MKFCDLKNIEGISPLFDAGNPFREWKGVYCCDLLSHALAHAPAGCAFVTVITNENTLAVALRRNVSFVVFAVAASTLPAFETGCLLQGRNRREL